MEWKKRYQLYHTILWLKKVNIQRISRAFFFTPMPQPLTNPTHSHYILVNRLYIVGHQKPSGGAVSCWYLVVQGGIKLPINSIRDVDAIHQSQMVNTSAWAIRSQQFSEAASLTLFFPGQWHQAINEIYSDFVKKFAQEVMTSHLVLPNSNHNKWIVDSIEWNHKRNFVRFQIQKVDLPNWMAVVTVRYVIVHWGKFLLYANAVVIQPHGHLGFAAPPANNFIFI